MTFNPNIPQPTQSLGETQPIFLQNNMDIQTFADQDHVAIGTAGQGKHSKIRMPQGGAVTTAANEGALYTKDLGGTDEPQLFYRYQSDGTEVQITGSQSPSVGGGNNGYIWLPGGLLMQWGKTSAGVGVTSGTVTFAGIGLLNYPNAIFSVIGSPELTVQTTTAFAFLNLTTTSFDFWGTGDAATARSINWIALGN